MPTTYMSWITTDHTMIEIRLQKAYHSIACGFWPSQEVAQTLWRSSCGHVHNVQASNTHMHPTNNVHVHVHTMALCYSLPMHMEKYMYMNMHMQVPHFDFQGNSSDSHLYLQGVGTCIYMYMNVHILDFAVSTQLEGCHSVCLSCTHAHTHTI